MAHWCLWKKGQKFDGVTHNQNSISKTNNPAVLSDTSGSDWKTYSNSKLGISLKYPPNWEQYNEKFSNYCGANSCPPGTPDQNFEVYFRAIGETGPESVKLILASNNNPPPGDGGMLNTRDITSQSIIDQYCEKIRQDNSSGVLNCEVLKNSHGFSFSRAILSQYTLLGDENDREVKTYYRAYTGNKAFPGVSFELGNIKNLQAADQIMSSVKIVK